MSREYFKDGKKQMSGPSNVYFHVFLKNPFTFRFECAQRRMMTFRMDSIKLQGNALKSLSDVHKIHLHRRGLQILLFQPVTYIIFTYLLTYICRSILALTHRFSQCFIFRPLKTFENCMVFWSFQAVRNRILVRYGLRTYTMLISHCKPMCCFLPPENSRKLHSFLKFSGGKKWNIGFIWDK